jgi:hypothetical protein
MAIRIDVTQRVVETVLILVQGLRFPQVGIESRIRRCVIRKVVQLIRAAGELIGAGETPLR